MPNSNSFSLQEAVELIYLKVCFKTDFDNYKQSRDIALLGHVCGLLTLNDQIEVVVKFSDDLKQFNKEEFFKTVQFVDVRLILGGE